MSDRSMPTITLSDYLAIHPDYRGVWETERDDLPNWSEVRHKYIGKRTMMAQDGSCTLLIEGISFEIVPNLQPNGETSMTDSKVERYVKILRDLRVLPDRSACGQLASEEYDKELKRLMELQRDVSRTMTDQEIRTARERANFAC